MSMISAWDRLTVSIPLVCEQFRVSACSSRIDAKMTFMKRMRNIWRVDNQWDDGSWSFRQGDRKFTCRFSIAPPQYCRKPIRPLRILRLKITFGNISAGETASFLKPDFKASQRYLAVLYSYKQDENNLDRVVRKLQQTEPDFSIRKMLDMTEYPSEILRSAAIAKLH